MSRIPLRRGKRCVYCGAPAFTIDHVPPRGFVGQTNRRVRACLLCNAALGDKLLLNIRDRASYLVLESSVEYSKEEIIHLARVAGLSVKDILRLRRKAKKVDLIKWREAFPADRYPYRTSKKSEGCP